MASPMFSQFCSLTPNYEWYNNTIQQELLATVSKNIVYSHILSAACSSIVVAVDSYANICAMATDADCVGPCEPGTAVNLEGIRLA